MILDFRYKILDFRFNFYLALTFSLVMLFGCKSMDLPKVEDSQKLIDNNKPEIDRLNGLIYSKSQSLPSGNDIILKMSMSALNKVIQTFAYDRQDDIILNFLQTKGFINEQKTALGIAYSTILNIDTGYVSLNLKSFKFDKFENNKLYANIEIEGKGNVSVSGKYTGIPASVSPDIQLYLNEPVSFDLTHTDNGSILVKPNPKTMILKTKIQIKIMGFNVPWYQEIPLEMTQLLKPMTIPLAIQSEIQFPLPAKETGTNKMVFSPYFLELTKTKVNTHNNKIEFRTDMILKEKK